MSIRDIWDSFWNREPGVVFPPPVVGKKYLGKKPARKYSVQFRLGDYIQDVVTIPKVFGFVLPTVDWGLLGNYECGDCVVAGAAHETMLWSRSAGKGLTRFDDTGVIRQYRIASGWNGISNDPTDVGLDMQEFASHRRKFGILDADGEIHKIKAYAAVSGVNELIQATYIFGAVGVGLMMPESTFDQFDAQRPWDIVSGSRVVGGHYVPCVGRNSKGHLLFITWGRLQAATPNFVARYMDEAIAYVSPDFITARGLSPRLVNQAKLEADLAALAK